MTGPTGRRLGRAALGVALVAGVGLPTLRNLPLLREALVWAPLRWGLWSLGLLAVAVAVWQTWAVWAEGGESRLPPRPKRRLWPEALAVAGLALGGVAVQLAWRRVASPHGVLSGFDFNTYALNAMAASTGEWSLFNGDKHAFHAELVALLAWGGSLRETMVDLSVLCIGLFPAVTYVLARRAGGRFGAGMAALLAFASPLPWHFSTQTTAYPLFYMLVLAAAAAILWAVQRPSGWSAVTAGALSGFAASTQEKAPIALLPVLGLALVLGAPAVWGGLRRHPRRTLATLFGFSALGLLVFVVVLRGTTPPVRYTSMVSLVTNQREEMHRELPYAWPVVKTPDILDPAGLRGWLPRFLWNGEIESWVAAARTPPDSNSLRLAREPMGTRNPWRVERNTSIAPVSVRLETSLRSLPLVVGPLPHAGLLLVVLGSLSLLTLSGRRARVAVALGGAVATGLAPLTLKFGLHYFPHLVPILAVLAMVGLDHLVCALLPGGWRWLGRLVFGGMGAAYALALWTGDSAAYRSPQVTFPPPAAVAPEDPGHYAENLLRVAEWMNTQTPPGSLVDCAPGSMLLAMPDDARISRVPGDASCMQGLERAVTGDWLFASRHPSFRGVHTPDPQKLIQSGRWRLLFGWDGPHGSLPLSSLNLPMSSLVVLELTVSP